MSPLLVKLCNQVKSMKLSRNLQKSLEPKPRVYQASISREIGRSKFLRSVLYNILVYDLRFTADDSNYQW